MTIKSFLRSVAKAFRACIPKRARRDSNAPSAGLKSKNDEMPIKGTKDVSGATVGTDKIATSTISDSLACAMVHRALGKFAAEPSTVHSENNKSGCEIEGKNGTTPRLVQLKNPTKDSYYEVMRLSDFCRRYYHPELVSSHPRELFDDCSEWSDYTDTSSDCTAADEEYIAYFYKTVKPLPRCYLHYKRGVFTAKKVAPDNKFSLENVKLGFFTRCFINFLATL